jgi:hypothetical protein
VTKQRLPVQVGHLLHVFLKLVVDLIAAHGLEVGARTENIPPPGQDRNSEFVVGIEQAPGSVHPQQHAGGERVLGLGSIQRHDQDRPVAFDQAVVDIHEFSSLGFAGASRPRRREAA